ncbi:MAG: secondary thiamine-phosphate synthase enzyme YjbQ [Euryarchaeota archaeon]|nr:secondary thiamine-phosphate synthase enzyme YjbQ [Euryarchaeota archaeon]MBU4547797.1 secondary thiamine-phosphate synthase enzyme YjbQ [Euryarchaeota archaeon]MBV1729726.1 secondary thiamine-phosphate synthase enzyme YjbQ [Methanobacterium sp.]MBV1755363.1 secondary thiamine-phosphate synthase enzyme YjbQ [Methanobacterium sp.]MBV1766871.1 secondary thiamine-phosphate synthase enzyme YjbQ [Methanobacterium sp.]
MQVFSKSLDINTSKRVEMVDITEDVEKILKTVSLSHGIINIFSRHSTSAIIINEHETNLLQDLEDTLEALVPENEGYGHNTIDNNADAHVRAILLGSSQSLPFENVKLDLGTWQSLFFVELDGPRARKIKITIMGD